MSGEARKRSVPNLQILWLFCLFCLISPLHADTAIPSLRARVTDQANLLDAAARQALEAKLAAFEQAKGSQIAVLIVPSTQPESIEQYSIRVTDAWKLGRKGVDDGVLLLLAMQDRALRIEVGRGLEGAIPDAIAKRVIAEVITPFFKRGDFAGGIDAGVSALIKLVDGEPLPAPPVRRGGQVDLGNAGPTLLILAVILGGVLRLFFGRLVGAGLAGTLAFIAGWLVLGSFIAGLVAAVLAFVFTLLRGAGGGISSGGGFGGGGFGGGGGFSGGGGGFSGGGASGRW
jgi:uncharacterized protein